MKKWRLDFRVWHWIHATVILGLLGTVFLRKTFLSWRTNSEILSQKLAEIKVPDHNKCHILMKLFCLRFVLR